MDGGREKSDRPDLELNYWCVAVVDHLGQRSRLRELRELPSDEASNAKTLDLLRATAGSVLRLRSSFADYFAAVDQPTEILTDLPPAALAEAREMRKVRVEQRGFSDSLVIAVSLRGDDEPCVPMNGIFAALYGSSGMMTAALAEGQPLRGGIDVGLAMKIEDGEVYGPALERAHKLEAEHAAYPRIVLGAELVRYISLLQQLKPKTIKGDLARTMAEHCAGLMTRDSDGLVMLDFLGPAMKAFAQPYTPELLRQAFSFVVEQHERFTRDANIKLAARYGRLRRYFEARLPEWGVTSRE